MIRLILLLSFFTLNMYAQSFNPYNNYKEIEDGNIRIIYPEGMENEANEVLSFIMYQNENNRGSVEGRLLNIPIILHKDTTVSNGFVTQGPFRSEFFGTAPVSTYDLSLTPWFITLAIHEYRHALQMMQGREATFNKVVYVLGGENAVGLGNVLAIPMWYWEGDAVAIETALTKGGRGRLNHFLKDYRSILLENEDLFSYEKAKNGSYIEKIPNHYLLGYMLVSYGREKYGNDFWKGIFTDATGYRGFLPLSKAIKKRTGLSSPEFYKVAMEWWREKWIVEEGEYSEYTEISPEKEDNISYFGAYEHKGKYLSLKKPYEDIESFVLIDEDANEELVVDKTISYSNSYSYNRSYILWDSFEAHKTMPMIDYSNILIYNMESGALKEITSKGKYFNPQLGNIKDYILATKIEPGNKNALVVLDFEGNEIKNFENSNFIYNDYTWSENDDKIFATIRDNKGNMALVSLDYNTKEEEILIPYDNYIIENLFYRDNVLYFSSTFDKIDNIYSYSLVDGNITKLTNSRYGAYSPSIINGDLVFSEHSNLGYKLSKTSTSNNYEFNLKRLHELEEYYFEYFDQEGGDILSKVEVKDYISEDYNSFKNLLNIHSWVYSYGEDELFLNMISSNETTDLNFEFAYTRDTDKDKNKFLIAGEFIRYWPNFRLEYERDNLKNKDNNEVEAILSFPINLTKGYYYRSLIPSISYMYNKDKNIELSSYKLNLSLTNSGLTDFAQSINLTYIDSIDKKAKKVSGEVYLNFSEYSQLGFAYEKEDTKNIYEYSETFVLPRAYKDIERDEISKVSLDYGIPIWHPDRGMNGLYIKRIRTNAFYDIAQYELADEKDEISSTGLEFYFDTALLSLVDFTIGFRYSYKIEDKESQFDVVIPLQSF